MRQFRVKSLPFLAGLLLSPFAAMGQPAPTAIFTSPVTSAPQVDATNFENWAAWNIDTTVPYETAHTLNYINENSMVGSTGWEFDYGPLPPPGGGRGMSGSFLNDFGATIQAVDGYVLNPLNSQYPSLVSYLWISATNVVNNGTLIGGGNGEIRLTGVDVDLFLGTLEITSFSRGGSGNGTTNFSQARAIYDEYWQQTGTFPDEVTPYTMNSSRIWNGASALSPTFYVNEPCLASNLATTIGFNPSLADSISMTNMLIFTNIVFTNFDLSTGTVRLPIQIFRQAVFANASSTNITLADRFIATGDPTNLFRTVSVRFTSSFGDRLYLVDTLASLTNRGLLMDLTTLPGANPLNPCSDPTYRPANYNLGGTAGQFSSGSPGVGPPINNFLYNANNTDFTNMIVQATYAGYSAYIDDLAANPFGAAVTNLPGRIIINATNLDLSSTIITNMGAEITIHAGNLISSTGAVVSCQNLSYNLGSATGDLNVTNLAGISAIPSLFSGTIDAFSALWTNGYSVVINNYSQVVVGSITNTVNTPITNNIEVDLHVLLVDASGLSTMAPTTVQDLILHSTNILVSDSMDVVSTLLFDGQSLTLLGTLDLSGNLQNWNYLIAPTLLYFTNNGVLSIPQDAHFGSDPLVYTTNTTPVIASATGTLFEMGTNGNLPPTNGITIGPYTYTFVNTITNTVRDQVQIAATLDGSMSNLIAAINHAAGSGINYSANTTANMLVTAGLLTNHSFTVTAKAAGSSGNSIMTTSSTTNLTWNGLLSTTLSGGVGGVTNVVTVGGAYDSFVNNGIIGAGGGVTINSGNFQNRGTLSATGGFSVTTSTGLVENASIISGQNVNFSAAFLTLGNSMITAGRQLNFNVTSSLTNMGCSSVNMLTCNQGFDLPFKPATGDLSGTTIQSVALDRNVVTSTWAATDLGPTAAGFTNNVAIGRLILDAQGAGSFFKFNGTGVSNAIYVDSLELLDYASYTNHDANGNLPMLIINPNLVIYYADATDADGEDVSQKLNHKNGDHLQWVANYTGCFASSPSSSTTTNVVGGVQPQLSASISFGQQFQLTVNGAANQVCILQDSTDLTNWVNICTGTPPFMVTNTANSPTRFYRAVTN